MVVIRICETGENLGTRADGRIVRNQILNRIDFTEKITLDFSNVQMISGSFADECIGALISEHGFDFVKANISITNTNKNVTLIIKQAIRDRLLRPTPI